MDKLILHYNHDSRTITQEDGAAISFEAARLLWEHGKLDDYNLALRTLASHDWDPDLVAEHYARMDAGYEPPEDQ